MKIIICYLLILSSITVVGQISYIPPKNDKIQVYKGKMEAYYVGSDLMLVLKNQKYDYNIVITNETKYINLRKDKEGIVWDIGKKYKISGYPSDEKLKGVHYVYIDRPKEGAFFIFAKKIEKLK